VDHKRTFMYLEQLILKHSADFQCLAIKNKFAGLDFYFGTRSHANKLISFLENHVPIRHRHDKQLVSHDTKSQTYNYKYTFSVEMVPICRDDVVCFPKKLYQQSGGLGPLVLCTRVNASLMFTDPLTLRSMHMTAEQYWRWSFRPTMVSVQLVEFIVLDTELTDIRDGKYVVAEVEVARVADFGVNDVTFHLRTHLGHVLKHGDTVLGYDLANTTNDGDMEEYVHAGMSLPDVVLVRKSYRDKRRRRREAGVRRTWQLKQLGVQDDLDGVTTRQAKEMAERQEMDRELFLEELEEDPEMRKNINLFRDPEVDLEETAQRKAALAWQRQQEGDSDDEDAPEVGLEELLDNLVLQDTAMAEDEAAEEDDED
jgi:nonsense-mediated mRNA decay protein 3